MIESLVHHRVLRHLGLQRYLIIALHNVRHCKNMLSGLIAGTNIASVLNYDEWVCTTDGLIDSDPCSDLWTGLGCGSGVVSSINMVDIGLTGSVV